MGFQRTHFTALVACAFAAAATARANDHFVETFDAFTNNSYITGNLLLSSGTWTGLSILGEASSASRGGAGRAVRINDDTAGAHLATPVLDTVGTVSFYWRELNTGGGTFKVQKSVAGGAYTDVGSLVYTGAAFTLYSVAVNDSNSSLRIRILNDNQYGHLIIDDMTVTDYGGGGPAGSPPTLNAIGAKAVGLGSNLQFTVTATPTDGDAVMLTVSNLPPGAFFYPTNETGSFLWTNASPTGTYSVTFNAADKDGADAKTVSITVNPSGGGGGALDIGGWKLIQSNSTQTFTFPADTLVRPQGYVIVARGASQPAFESAWGVSLGTNVVFLTSAGGTMPQLNGGETYTLLDGSGGLVDGTTPASLNPQYMSVQRTNLAGSATDAANWSSAALEAATPGASVAGAGAAGLRISEYADASNFSNEFIELFYDAPGEVPSNQPPVLAAIGNKTTEQMSALQFNVQAADPVDGDTIKLSMSNAPAGAVLSSTNGQGAFFWALPTPDGVYTTRFYAADKDGADVETITITVTPRPAAVTSNLWDFEDDWQGWTNVSRFSNKDWARLNTPGAESSSWEMEINGYQGNTNSDDWLISPALNLTMVTDPSIRYWTMRANNGPDLQVKISTNYPGAGDPLAPGVSWSALPFTRPSSQNVWALWTNDLSAYIGQGQVHVAFYYTSGTRYNQAARWSVDQVRFTAVAAGASNEPPVLAPIGNQALIVSNNLMFPVTAVDPVDYDAITLRLSNAPPGSTFGATNGHGYFAWLSAAPVGVYTSTFHAADKDGTDFETILITVSEPPGPTNPPVLAAIGHRSVVESNTLQFSVSASEPDGDPIELSFSNLPPGATFSATNERGFFHWAGAAPAGSYTSVFYAADDDGADWESVVITVHPVAPTGTIVFQGFDGAAKDTWGYSGAGTNLADAARTDGYGRRIVGREQFTLQPVSLIGHRSVMLHVHCASTGGIENLDALEVYVALDGAAFGDTPDVTLQEGDPADAEANKAWAYTARGVAVATAGFPANFYGDGEDGYATIRLRLPDGATNVTVRIAAANSGSNECYQLDDIELTSGTWVFHDPPVLARVGDRSGRAGEALLFDVSATDPDGDPIALVASNLPAGAVFVDGGGGSGRFLWAAPAAVGIYTASFHAVTADGSDAETVRISIGEAVVSSNVFLTVMAANITSGSQQAYEEPGLRIFQGLRPDIVGIQEFNYSQGQRALVDAAFGDTYHYFCEGGNEQIPNGIISRYPILSSGEWIDPYVSNRDMAWAIIDIPGTQDLHIVSVHFLTTGSAERNNQAAYLRGCIQTNWPNAAYVVVAGDLNTAHREEAALSTLSAVVTDAVKPADQNGDMDTNAGRSSDYDYVLPNTNLNARHVGTTVGGLAFTNGIVFDSRLWASPPEPIQSSDSGVNGMQHMAVMKTFALEQAPAPATSAAIYVLAGPGGAIAPTGAVVNFGQSQTFSITAAAHYAVADVKVDGASIGASNSYTFLNVTGAHSLAATFVYNAANLLLVDANGPGSGSEETAVTLGSQQNCSNLNPLVTAGSTQYLLVGWSGSGSAPASGSGPSTGPFTISTNSAVTWLWNTNYWLDTEAGAGGGVDVADRWAAFGSNLLITATPDAYHDFGAWSGDAPSGQETNPAIALVMNGPKQVTASFAALLAVHDVPHWWLAAHGWTSDFDLAALADQDGDTMLTWQEYLAGTIPTNKASLFLLETRRTTPAGAVVLAWPSAAGRSYDLDVRTNPAHGVWIPWATNLPAVPPVNLHTGSFGGSDRLLFRVRVRHTVE